MTRPPDLIINCQKEIARLQGLLARGEPQMALLYGRRRVGKTCLLGRIWHDVPSFYFTASETTPTQNREALLSAFAEWSGETIHTEDYPTWCSIFRLLLDHRPGEPLALVIDEFQYLGENAKDLDGVASELNAAWEMRRELPRPEAASGMHNARRGRPRRRARRCGGGGRKRIRLACTEQMTHVSLNAASTAARR